jgi:hypothetical protein
MRNENNINCFKNGFSVSIPLASNLSNIGITMDGIIHLSDDYFGIAK